MRHKTLTVTYAAAAALLLSANAGASVYPDAAATQSPSGWVQVSNASGKIRSTSCGDSSSATTCYYAAGLPNDQVTVLYSRIGKYSGNEGTNPFAEWEDSYYVFDPTASSQQLTLVGYWTASPNPSSGTSTGTCTTQSGTRNSCRKYWTQKEFSSAKRYFVPNWQMVDVPFQRFTYKYEATNTTHTRTFAFDTPDVI